MPAKNQQPRKIVTEPHTNKNNPSDTLSARERALATNIAIGFAILLFCLPAFVFLYLMFSTLLPELFDAPLLLVNSLLFIALAFGLYRLEIRVVKRSKASIAASLFLAGIIVLALSYVTIPLYQHYRVATTPSAMSSFLERRYQEPFNVENAAYYSGSALGDSHGVSAWAYPKSDPGLRFRLFDDSYDHYKGYDIYDNAIDQKISQAYEAKYHDLIIPALEQYFDDQYTVSLSANYDAAATPSERLKAYVRVESESVFNQQDWAAHKKNILHVADIVRQSGNTDAIITYELNGEKTGLDDFSCILSPTDRKTVDQTSSSAEKWFNSYLKIQQWQNTIH